MQLSFNIKIIALTAKEQMEVSRSGTNRVYKKCASIKLCKIRMQSRQE